MVVILIEPFYGGSHKQLMDIVTSSYLGDASKYELYTMPAKKWHWRARTSALYFAQKIDRTLDVGDIVFCSSVLNLAELVALRPDVAKCRKKIVYFHENQLVYPVKKAREERDFQYGYNQILSALVADKVLFNSEFNLRSFLDSLKSFLKLQPDNRPDANFIREKIESKSSVLYFPLELPIFRSMTNNTDESSKVLHIVWPHRWEHDKDPDTFFQALFQLREKDNLDFKLSVLGQTFEDVPATFREAQDRLGAQILHFGRLENRADYFEVLQCADVVVSTAEHEFFGVAMIEAASSGCYPLVPDRLVYPEIYPPEFRYRTPVQLYKRLREFCRNPKIPATLWTEIMADKICGKFSLEKLRDEYLNILME